MNNPHNAEKMEKKRVAIVGSGMAGLSLAYLLQHDVQGRYQVKVFETQAELSLDSASVSIAAGAKDTSLRVDLPMRAFAGGFYPNLQRMYDYLRISYRPKKFVYQFMRYPDPIPHFQHASLHHQFPPPRPCGLGFVEWILEALYLALCYAYFTLCCLFVPPQTVPTGKLGEEDGYLESLAEYLRRIRLPYYFTKHYLLPLMSSVATCLTHKQLLSFPASDLIQYKRATNGKPHFVVKDGVQTVQKTLSSGLNILTNAYVTSVVPRKGPHGRSTVEVSWKQGRQPGGITAEMEERLVHSEEFDVAVLAVSPDVVGQIFPTLEQQMKRIPTLSVESFVHRDLVSFGSTSSWQGSAADMAEVLRFNTHNGTTESVHFVTSSLCVTTRAVGHPTSTSGPGPVDTESKVIHRVRFTRVLRTPESQKLVNQLFSSSSLGPKCGSSLDSGKSNLGAWQSGDSNVYLVGGWCWDGMVLLEGCIVSAMRVARSLGVEVPWDSQQDEPTLLS